MAVIKIIICAHTVSSSWAVLLVFAPLFLVFILFIYLLFWFVLFFSSVLKTCRFDSVMLTRLSHDFSPGVPYGTIWMVLSFVFNKHSMCIPTITSSYVENLFFYHYLHTCIFIAGVQSSTKMDVKSVVLAPSAARKTGFICVVTSFVWSIFCCSMLYTLH